MVRVPTYASYMSLVNQTMKTKAMANMYSYQATTGIKYANYAGYGMKASNIVNMESSLAVTQNFIDNNTVLNTSVKTMSTVLENIEDSVSSFKSQLNNAMSAFSNLSNGSPITPEVSASLSELQTVAFSALALVADALDQSVAGKYIFGAGSSGAPVDFPYATLEDFQKDYDGIFISYPLTENAVLSSRSVNYASSGALNISASSLVINGGATTTGDLTLSATNNTLTATVAGAFNDLSAGDTIVLDDGGTQTTYTISSVSGGGTVLTFNENVAADAVYLSGTGVTITEPLPDNEFLLSAANGFLTPVIEGGVNTTGNLFFSANDDTLHAEVYGAFNTIHSGDTLMFDDNGTKKAYTVASVSADGKTITFADDITADQTIADGTGVTISTSFALGTVLDFKGSTGVPERMQVLGMNDSGELLVRADSAQFTSLPTSIPVSSHWSLTSDSYYVGGAAKETFRISDNQTITLDINANDKVFTKLFRAFGMVAQGNIIQTDASGNVTNVDEFRALMNDAALMLQSAIDNNGRALTGKNETLSVCVSKISADYVTLNNVANSLEALKNNLADNIYDIKNVDQTEAAAKLLFANNSLEASYQVLSSTLDLSLLNFLK